MHNRQKYITETNNFNLLSPALINVIKTLITAHGIEIQIPGTL